MKVAVTGASGFIGKWVLSMLKEKYDLIAMGRCDVGYVDACGVPYRKTDYSIENLAGLFADCDAVAHLAGVRSGSTEFQHFLPNIVLAANVFEACRIVNISNIVVSSTKSVYTEDNDMPWHEKQAVKPNSFYGISKATAEQIGCYYNHRYDVKIKLLRIAQVIGYGERPGYMLGVFINQAFHKKPILLFGEGQGRREYIYVKDVVEAINMSLTKPDVSGIFNIGLGQNISHAELARLINEVFDNKEKIQYKPDLREDTSVQLMNINKSAEELSWKPRWTLFEGLAEIKGIMGNDVKQS